MGTLAFDQVKTSGDGTNTPKNNLVSCVNGKTNNFVEKYQMSYNVYVAGIAALTQKFSGN
jgi:hypothetical protein